MRCFGVLALLLVASLVPLFAQGGDGQVKAKLNTRVTCSFAETPLGDALQMLREVTGVEMKFDPDCKGVVVTVDAKEERVEDVLKAMLRPKGLDFVVRNGAVFVADKKRISALRRGDGGEKPVASAGRSIADFGVELYKRLAAGNRENLFFSPASIELALAMTYAGARGQTAAQMKKALRLELADDELHSAFATLKESLLAKKKGLSVSVANALWGQKDYSFKEAFVDLLRKHYGAGLRRVDFKGDSEGARRTINRWVEKETREKIKRLIPEGALGALTRLVLTNAIYFKGEDVDMMRMPAGRKDLSKKFLYLGTEKFRMLELPYSGGEFAMVMLLPRKRDGLADLEKELTAEALQGWLSKMRKTKLGRVCIPKFEITWGTKSLKKALVEMGMADAFDQTRADFTGMTDEKPPLYVSDVLHKAFVKVDEEGTEAAAATAVVMKALGIAPQVVAGHPFVFLMRHRKTDTILFMGRVTKPKAE